MEGLRHTDTNAADDSKGRAFGLDGNLYLPVVIAGMAGLAIYSVLALMFHAGFLASGLVVALPFGAVCLWVLLLRNNRPPGYDRDLFATWCGGGDFQRGPCDEEVRP